MECTGRFKGLGIDLMSKQQRLEIEVDNDIREEYEALRDKPKLKIKITRYKKKRSLDANAYYWVLLTKFAKVLRLSNPEAHNLMVSRYGQFEMFDGKKVCLSIPDTEDAEERVRQSTDYHLYSTPQVREGKDGISYRTYLLMRGSHEYDTAEMARLIDGLIVSCKEAGIPETEIASPNEKEILKERYGVNFG